LRLREKLRTFKKNARNRAAGVHLPPALASTTKTNRALSNVPTTARMPAGKTKPPTGAASVWYDATFTQGKRAGVLRDRVCTQKNTA
jgi:hypothetical protein